jgi:DNA-binding transcriptional LysR family regulator
VASTSPALRAHIDKKLRIAGVTPRIAAETLHHDAMKNLVAQDCGYSMVLRSVVADELARGQLVALRLPGRPITVDLVAVYRTRPSVPSVVRRFIDFTREQLLNRKRHSVGPSTPRTDAAPMGRPRARPRRGSGVSGRPRKAGTRS